MKKTYELALSIGLSYLILLTISTLLNIVSLRVVLMIFSQLPVTDFINEVVLSMIIPALTIPVILIFLLIFIIKKLNENQPIKLLNNDVVRIVTGVIIVLNGVFEISISLRTIIYILNTNFSSQQGIAMQSNYMILTPIIIQLILIVMGVYLIKFYKSK